MKKCRYCDMKIEASNIRCSDCDVAWQEGRNSGIKEWKDKVSETIATLINLLS